MSSLCAAGEATVVKQFRLSQALISIQTCLSQSATTVTPFHKALFTGCRRTLVTRCTRWLTASLIFRYACDSPNARSISDMFSTDSQIRSLCVILSLVHGTQPGIKPVAALQQCTHTASGGQCSRLTGFRMDGLTD